MSSNAEYVAKVEGMDESDLLDAVMENPEYLTDPYYFYPLGQALQKRYEELRTMKEGE